MTRIEVAPSTTWALVSTSPSAVMTMPVPCPVPRRPLAWMATTAGSTLARMPETSSTGPATTDVGPDDEFVDDADEVLVLPPAAVTGVSSLARLAPTTPPTTPVNRLTATVAATHIGARLRRDGTDDGGGGGGGEYGAAYGGCGRGGGDGEPKGTVGSASSRW